MTTNQQEGGAASYLWQRATGGRGSNLVWQRAMSSGGKGAANYLHTETLVGIHNRQENKIKSQGKPLIK